VKSYRDKIKSFLERKHSLLMDIIKIVDHEKALLANEQMTEFLAACSDVDKILENIKSIDYEIARLESISETDNYSADLSLQKLLDSILALSNESQNLIDELTAEAMLKKKLIKSELDDTVRQKNIGGYKPYSENRAVYFDKRN
jgi:hypothetical protein